MVIERCVSFYPFFVLNGQVYEKITEKPDNRYDRIARQGT